KCAGRAADQSRHAVSGYSAAPRGNLNEETKAKRKAQRIVARCWQSTSPSWKAGEGGCSSARNSSVCVEGRQSRRRETLGRTSGRAVFEPAMRQPTAHAECLSPLPVKNYLRHVGR